MLLNKIIPYFFEDKDKIPDIKSIQIDSRVENKEGLFICQNGLTNNSHNFIEQAIENGAVAIIHTQEIKKYIDKYTNVLFLKVENSNKILGECIDRFYNSPTSKLKVVAVTGTNGKTTTSYLIQQLMSRFEKTGYLGTLGYIIDDKIITSKNHMTTPDALTLNSILAEMVENNTKNVAIELSSHGLELGRADIIDVDIAVFTNLTHDHLDFHHNMQNYLNAKAKLFKNIKSSGVAILNMDDKYYSDFKNLSNCKTISYGKHKNADFRITDIKLYPNKSCFTMVNKASYYKIETNIVGEFNIYNLSAALIAIQNLGIPIDKVVSNLMNISLAIGRMDVYVKNGITAIVDFAHTPDGMKKVFEFAKSTLKENSRILTVFGSAGSRDKQKRPIMGKLADEYCDLIVLTEDDYRFENPVEICRDISDSIANKNKVFVEINRKKAIEFALSKANSDDIVLILGKGIDDFMDIGSKSEPYIGDYNIVRDYFEKTSNN